MNFDPNQRTMKSKDDWYPTSSKPKRLKRKLILLQHRKYFHFKGTMKRVKMQPTPAILCVVMQWVDGEPDAQPCQWFPDAKYLFVNKTVNTAHEFPSRSEAKHAIWHTVSQSGLPGSHVDYVIVNKAG